MLRRVAGDLKQRGIGFRVEQEALETLADHGYDPEFGARPMRRAIQNYVENALAELILQGSVSRRDTIVLGAGCKLRVEQ
jgi:ATP-dependent Clp protease ATP-binding subunit ClpB